MTHPGTPRDLNLQEWLNSVGYHAPADNLARLGHEVVRALVGQLGIQLHYVVPPGADKSTAFRKLREVMFYANAQLAVAGGPGAERVTEGGLQGMLEDTLGDGEWLDRANLAVLAKHPEAGWTPSPPLDLLALERALVDVLRATLGAHHEIGSADYTKTARAVLDALWTDRTPPAVDVAPSGYRSPFKPHGHDGEHHSMRFPAPSVDGIRGHVPMTPEEDAAARELAERTPISAAALEGLTGLTPAVAEVTPATMTGGIQEAPADDAPHTIWGLNPGRGHQGTDLGVTQGAGFVALAVVGDARAAVVSPPTAPASGHAVTLGTLDAVNLVLETIAAAAGRAFTEG